MTPADPQFLLAERTPLQAGAATVHVWAFSLEGTAECIERCRAALAPEERQRADRFVFERDRIRYTVAHAVLRHLLSRYCGTTPESLRFTSTQAGKPTLVFPAAAVHFNLSHSENRGLLGVCADRELGIDLEKIRSDIEALSISRHYFFGSERDTIEAAPEGERERAFFRYWVAKEAVLKAQGVGLGFPLDRFRVDFLPDGESARIGTLDPTRLRGDWTVRMLPCEAGWLAAVVTRGTDWVVKLEGPRGPVRL